MKRVLVTGANGQLGKTIKGLFESNNENIEFIFVTKSELDITKEQELKDYFRRANHFDYCINCAAYTNVEQAEKTPEMAYKVNAEGVEFLANTCKETNTVLIHISTDYVFDGERREPYTVNDKPNPINEYGRSKLLGEQQIKKILERYFIVRTSWLYSKKYGRNFYRTILEKAKKGEDLKITEAQIGCPTETTSLVNFIINELIINDKEFGVYHFTDGIGMTWYSFAKKTIEDNQLDVKISPKEYLSKVNRPTNSKLL